jgi:formylmethanofuran dehydrogenase subunit E
MNNESEREELPAGPYPCERCGNSVPAERAFAPMETLEVLCPACLREALKPCEGCGAPIRASAYQHLPTGKVLCEPCVLREISTGSER